MNKNHNFYSSPKNNRVIKVGRDGRCT